MATNGTKSILQTVITSVIVASLLSGGGVFVSVKVMGADLDRAKTDLAEAETTIRTNREELVALKAAKGVSDERDAQRWDDVKAELIKIRSTQEKILRALPDRWRAAEPGRR